MNAIVFHRGVSLPAPAHPALAREIFGRATMSQRVENSGEPAPARSPTRAPHRPLPPISENEQKILAFLRGHREAFATGEIGRGALQEAANPTQSAYHALCRLERRGLVRMAVRGARCGPSHWAAITDPPPQPAEPKAPPALCEADVIAAVAALNARPGRLASWPIDHPPLCPRYPATVYGLIDALRERGYPVTASRGQLARLRTMLDALAANGQLIRQDLITPRRATSAFWLPAMMNRRTA